MSTSTASYVGSSGMKKKDVLDWDNKNVIEWLKSKNLQFSQKVIENQEITGYDLFYLTDENLKNEFKMEIFHERQKILKEIRLLALDECKIIFNRDSKTWPIL